MTTYSDYEQRQLDIASGHCLDDIATRRAPQFVPCQCKLCDDSCEGEPYGMPFSLLMVAQMAARELNLHSLDRHVFLYTVECKGSRWRVMRKRR